LCYQQQTSTFVVVPLTLIDPLKDLFQQNVIDSLAPFVVLKMAGGIPEVAIEFELERSTDVLRGIKKFSRFCVRISDNFISTGSECILICRVGWGAHQRLAAFSMDQFSGKFNAEVVHLIKQSNNVN
jgi:hypothetical protein